MTTRHLSRPGGAAAMLAALLHVVGSVVPASAQTTTLAGFYLVTDVFILLGLMGWYVAQHDRLGFSGLLGFVASVVGVAVIRSNGDFPGVDTYSIGAPVLVIGLIVLSASAWRARLMPAWVPGALVVEAVLGPVGYLAPGVSVLFAASDLAFSVGFGGAGVYLWRAGVGSTTTELRTRKAQPRRAVRRRAGGRAPTYGNGIRHANPVAVLHLQATREADAEPIQVSD